MIDSILITGGLGFIGSNIANFYAKQGIEVHIIDNMYRSNLIENEEWKYHNLERLNHYDNIKIHIFDLRYLHLINNFFQNHTVNAVIHTAGQTAVTTSLENPKLDFEYNIKTTVNLLEAMRKANQDPSLLFCSTNKIYGNNVNSLPVIENDNYYEWRSGIYHKGIPEVFDIDQTKHTPYGVSKLAADLYVQEWGKTYGIKTGVFRMSCIYGPNQFGIEDQGWLSHFILSALQDKEITIYGDGKQVRDLLFVSDLINLFHLFIENSRIKHTVLNVGGGPKNTLSILQSIEIIEKLIYKEVKHHFREWRDGDQKVFISDISKAFKLLGWEPRIPPFEGIQHYLDWILLSNISPVK